MKDLIEKIEEIYRDTHGNGVHKDCYIELEDKMIKLVEQHTKDKAMELLDRLEELGHGRGNWRRLISLEKERIQGDK